MHPAGLWKLGITWASFTGPSASAASKASRSSPSDSSGTGTSSAPVPPEQQQRAVVGGLLDDHPVAGLDHVRKSSAAASIEPLVTITWPASIPWSSVAIHSQSPGWPIPVP